MKEVIVRMKELVPIIREKINTNELAQLKVKGSSMEPFFYSDKTIVTLGKIDVLKRFDVILFQKEEDQYILHRVIHINKDIIITMGDGLKQREVCSINQVIAKVTSFETNNITYTINSKRYLFKVKVWYLLKPIRRILLKLMRAIKRGDSVE